MNFDIEFERKFTAIRFSRSANLDRLNHKKFRQRVIGSYNRGDRIIIDFENVFVIDSAGLSSLIYVRNKILETQGTLLLVNLNENILHLMRLVDILHLFDIFNSMKNAIRVSMMRAHQRQAKQQPILFIQVRHEDNYSIVKIKRPNSFTRPICKKFLRKIQEYFERSAAVILDFNNIRSIDNAGIAALIDLKHYAKLKRKNLILVYKDRIISRLFRMYSLEEILPHFENINEAIFTVNGRKNLHNVNRTLASNKALRIGKITNLN